MVRNLSFIFTSLLLQVSDFYFIEGIHLLEEIFIIILSPDFHANPLFLLVFFPRQLFDNHSFMGIPVIRSLSKVARGYLPTVQEDSPSILDGFRCSNHAFLKFFVYKISLFIENSQVNNVSTFYYKSPIITSNSSIVK